ncbi:putative arylsulfatase A-like [Penaeus vannamei]|uniref:Putative arylsulfatase A-like n=1 Tax=Penaeus vannamei TaxID=6689 RepID=A0A423U5L2_PENVA|nr:putative arylsulfatase A-like [Penaeus vannamei]
MATKYMLITCFLLAIVVSVSAGAGNKIKGKKKIKSNVSRPPNVIVLFADDLGFGDLSFSGHPTSRTPHIDQLAANGRFFNQFYVTSPVCSPSSISPNIRLDRLVPQRPSLPYASLAKDPEHAALLLHPTSIPTSISIHTLYMTLSKTTLTYLCKIQNLLNDVYLPLTATVHYLSLYRDRPESTVNVLTIPTSLSPYDPNPHHVEQGSLESQGPEEKTNECHTRQNATRGRTIELHRHRQQASHYGVPTQHPHTRIDVTTRRTSLPSPDRPGAPRMHSATTSLEHTAHTMIQLHDPHVLPQSRLAPTEHSRAWDKTQPTKVLACGGVLADQHNHLGTAGISPHALESLLEPRSRLHQRRPSQESVLLPLLPSGK